MSYARRVDGPHAAIRDGLRQCGWLVFDARGLADGGPDLIAATPGRRVVVLFEVKREKGGRLRPKQQQLLDLGWPIRVVRSLEEALQWGLADRPHPAAPRGQAPPDTDQGERRAREHPAEKHQRQQQQRHKRPPP